MAPLRISSFTLASKAGNAGNRHEARHTRLLGDTLMRQHSFVAYREGLLYIYRLAGLHGMMAKVACEEGGVAI